MIAVRGLVIAAVVVWWLPAILVAWGYLALDTACLAYLRRRCRVLREAGR